MSYALEKKGEQSYTEVKERAQVRGTGQGRGANDLTYQIQHLENV